MMSVTIKKILLNEFSFFKEFKTNLGGDRIGDRYREGPPRRDGGGERLDGGDSWRYGEPRILPPEYDRDLDLDKSKSH